MRQLLLHKSLVVWSVFGRLAEIIGNYWNKYLYARWPLCSYSVRLGHMRRSVLCAWQDGSSRMPQFYRVAAQRSWPVRYRLRIVQCCVEQSGGRQSVVELLLISIAYAELVKPFDSSYQYSVV